LYRLDWRAIFANYFEFSAATTEKIRPAKILFRKIPCKKTAFTGEG
jgi:hypothetical protein